ncbi:MAG TPA: FtsX-like permease family protein [Coriobacteriia bacterium]|jgi:putative ABC transport system permease protein
MRTALTLAWRYLNGRRLRSFLTSLAVIFGVMIIFSLNSLLPTITATFDASVKAAAGAVDLEVTGKTDQTFSTDVLQKVRRTEGVDVATGVLQQAIPLPPKAPTGTISLTGVDPLPYSQIHPPRVLSGRFLVPSDGNAMVIGEGLAKSAGLGPGDTFAIPSATGSIRFKIVGVISAPAIGTEQVWVPLKAAQAMLSQGGLINVIDASYVPNANHDEIARMVSLKLGPRYKIGGIAGASQLFANLQTAQAAFDFFGFMALAMGGFIIFNSFRTIVSERRRDIGMLRAIGASRGTVIGIIGIESFLQGALGTGLGLVAGYFITVGMLAGLAPIYETYLHMSVGPPIFTAGNFILTISLGLGVTLVGGLYPAITASRISPLDALRPNMADVDTATYTRRGIIGAVMGAVALALFLARSPSLATLGAFLFLIGLIVAAPALVRPIATVFGRAFTLLFASEGEVARANMARQPGRAAVTASAMMIGLGVIVAMLGLVTSIFAGFFGYLDKSLGADYLLIPQNIVLASGNVGAGPQLTSEIQKTPGVGTVSTLRIASAQMNGKDIEVLGIDPKTYPQVSGLQFSGGNANTAYADLAGGRSLIVNAITASTYNVKVGDVVTLATAEGDKKYRAVAVGNDYLTAKLSTVYISQDKLKEDFHVSSDVLLMANRRPGADAATVQKSLEKVVKQFPAFKLYTAGSWRAEQSATFGATMFLFYGLVAVLAAPSLLALLNTLAMSVLERTREIGMLRAVGSTRRQIRRMVLAESLLLSAAGTGFGLLAGLLLGYALTEATASIYPIAYYFPYSGIVTAIAVGLLSGVVASIIPARSAARLDIIQALQYE